MVARLAADSYNCVWTVHHILLDGRSFATVLGEVFATYDALCRGEEPKLSAPPSFRDHIEWLQQQIWSAHECFWRKKLKGISFPTPLGTIGSSVKPAGAARRSDIWSLELPEQLTSSLRTFASDLGVTLNTLVHGAWALVLSRYSGEEDVLFGTIRACRRSTVPSADSTTGIFTNTVPLRVTVPADTSLRNWLKARRSQEFELREHENTPLIVVLDKERPSPAALFDSGKVDHANQYVFPSVVKATSHGI